MRECIPSPTLVDDCKMQKRSQGVGVGGVVIRWDSRVGPWCYSLAEIDTGVLRSDLKGRTEDHGLSVDYDEINFFKKWNENICSGHPINVKQRLCTWKSDKKKKKKNVITRMMQQQLPAQGIFPRDNEVVGHHYLPKFN